MLIEKIIEFKGGGLGPLAVHVLLYLLIFVIKRISLRKTFEWIITAKIFQDAVHHTSPT